MKFGAAILIAALACPAHAADPLYPDAQCAAFVLGRDDYARRSAYLPRTPGDIALAAAFRDKAVRLNGGKAAKIDAFIASERAVMAFMVEAYIFGGDDQSRDMHDRLAEICLP